MPPALQDFYKAGGRLPDGVWEEILAAVAEVEAAYGAKFADPADPLLFSVRSGAAVSMPVSVGPGGSGSARRAPACTPGCTCDFRGWWEPQLSSY